MVFPVSKKLNICLQDLNIGFLCNSETEIENKYHREKQVKYDYQLCLNAITADVNIKKLRIE